MDKWFLFGLVGFIAIGGGIKWLDDYVLFPLICQSSTPCQGMLKSQWITFFFSCNLQQLCSNASSIIANYACKAKENLL